MKNKKILVVIGVVAVLIGGIVTVVVATKDDKQSIDVHVVDDAPLTGVETDEAEEEPVEEETEEEETEEEDPYADYERTGQYDDQLDPDGGDFVIEGDPQNMLDDTERTGGVTREEYDRVNNTSEEDLEKSEEIFGMDEGGVPVE